MTDAGPDAAPVAGQLIQVDAVVPSPEQRKADARGRIGNTAVQASVPAALIIVGSWIASFWHLDLDPIGTGRDLPGVVAGAIGSLLTVLIAWRMNKPNLRP